MIIGISGKMQSGKDTVALIIQYLYSKNAMMLNTLDSEREFNEFLRSKYKPAGSEFHIKRFADKVKDIVCLLINCTREDLEKDSFKDMELSPEWSIYKLHAKHNFSRNLESHVIYTSRADAERRAQTSRYHLIGYHIEKINLTPRKLLQLVGTECGRQIIHPNIWINATMSMYQAKVKFDDSTTDGNTWTYPNWIIPDVRFINEAESIKSRNGLLIRVERPIDLRFPDLFEKWPDKTMLTEPDYNWFLKWLKDYDIVQYAKLTHESEIGLDDYKEFNHTINNCSDLTDLISEIKSIIRFEGIIK